MKSYIVETTSGGLYLRNRKFIKGRRNYNEEEVEEKEEKEALFNEGEQGLLDQQRERAEPALTPRSYAAVVAGSSRIQPGPVTRSRAKLQDAV